MEKITTRLESLKNNVCVVNLQTCSHNLAISNYYKIPAYDSSNLEMVVVLFSKITLCYELYRINRSSSSSQPRDVHCWT
jgi:hypothetical protein